MNTEFGVIAESPRHITSERVLEGVHEVVGHSPLPSLGKMVPEQGINYHRPFPAFTVLPAVYTEYCDTDASFLSGYRCGYIVLRNQIKMHFDDSPEL